MNMVRLILHLEGAAILLGAIWAYFGYLEGWWVAFVVLLLIPDVSILGFLGGTRVGAIAYNLVHNYVLAAGMVGVGLLAESELLIGLGLIFIAHVGMDRALGYGLKFPTHFKDTHLQRLSTPARAPGPPPGGAPEV